LKTKNHRFLKHYERILKKHQQHLSRKTKGSKRFEKQRVKLAKIHEKISNSKLDLIHKTTLNLINEFDTIYLEDLNIKGMMKKPKPKKDENGKYLHNNKSRKSGLNKSISDVSWGKFIEILTYKAQWNDKEIVHIDRFFPSSKTCHKCGWINHNLTIKDRKWECSECRETLDRDVNAAINILNEGHRKNMSAGTADYKHGAEIRLSSESKSYEVFKEKPLN
jgi:putative transposase